MAQYVFYNNWSTVDILWQFKWLLGYSIVKGSEWWNQIVLLN
jgi:hypothetical protein